MAFSTRSELRTFADLWGVLAPLGYDISQKARVLDAVRAAAENPSSVGWFKTRRESLAHLSSG